MITKYIKGIEVNGVVYGFKDKKLHRLPQMIGKRFYPLKEVPIIKVGNKRGYNLYRKKRLSFAQVESLLMFINIEVQDISDDEMPF